MEITVKYFKQLFNDEDKTFRIDSEHYKKEYQVILNKIMTKKNVRLQKLLRQPVTTGHTPSMKITRYYGGDIKFIKTDNLRENRVSPPFAHYLSEEGNEIRKNSALKKGDIITTIIGATKEIVGRTSIIQEEVLPANINQNIALIRADYNKIIPNYLNIYLNTKFGRGLLYYHSRQTEQVNLNCREVERVLVPLFDDLQIVVSDLVLKIEQFKVHYKHLYSQAEKILLEEVGLLNFEPSQEPINIKSFQESFGTSGRLDAEYYQKKYESIESAVLGNKNGFTCIRNEFKQVVLKSKKEKSGYNYIEIGDVNVGDGSCKFNYIETGNLPENAKILVQKGDILISKVRPYRGAVSLIEFDVDDLIVSGAFTVLRKKESSVFSNEVLKVLLRTSSYKEWLLKFNVGTSYPVIKDEDVLSLYIPNVPINFQKNVTKKVQKSQVLKRESEHLLEVAKRAVEIAIEENEDVALAYINQETKE